MRIGLFVAITAFLLALVGLFLPIKGSFATLPGAELRSRPIVARCLRLSYRPEVAARWMPQYLRLQPQPASVFDRPGAPGYVAEGWPGYAGYQEAGWRPASPDSIDIGWHHSPIMRLPLPQRATKDTLHGRGGWWSYTNLFSALAREGDFVVQAVEIECPASSRSRSRLTL